MGRKLLATLTAFALLLSMCSTALADNTAARETDFFTDQPHADLDFSEIEYERVDAEAVLLEMDELRGLLDNAENAAVVEKQFNALTDRYLYAMTMYTLAEIQSCRDAADEKAARELEASYSSCLTIADAMPLLIRDILQSPCAAFLETQLGEEAVYYLNYEPSSKKQLELSRQEAALESAYRQEAVKPYTVEYFGREWDMQSLMQAYFGDGSIDAATYIEIYGMLAQEENDALGGIYLSMVRLRRNIAAAHGYSNYSDYAYKLLYGRDYSPTDIQTFREAVKEYIVPLNAALQALSSTKNSSVYFDDYSGDIALDMMEPYIGQMSSELLESFSYMRDHHLYDTEESETKIDTGFTAVLHSYQAPFLFNSPSQDLFAFTTAVHEFGHYNNAYWQAAGWHEGFKSQDVMEVHSQAFELLFSHYYPDIFGSDAEDVLNYQISSLVGAICEGAYYDELQQYAYSMKNITLQQINQEAARLSVVYGFAEEDSPMSDVYGLSWVQVSHNFTDPFYYISYAVSAAGAFTFWLNAQKDYFSAVDSYLAFTALDASYDFQESFEELGLSSPLSTGYLEKLAQALWTELKMDQKLEALSNAAAFPDVSADSWYAPYVTILSDLGCIESDEDGNFQPNDDATWGTAMGALLALTGQKPELEDGNAISRQEFCQLVVEVLGIPIAETEGPSPFTDTQDSAVATLAALGVISGYDNGDFRPDGSLTRAELCVILCRAAAAMSLIELPEAGASEEETVEITGKAA